MLPFFALLHSLLAYVPTDVTQPGSDMAKAEKLWAKKQRKLAAKRARTRHLQQMQLRRQQRQAARRGERVPQVVSDDCFGLVSY